MIRAEISWLIIHVIQSPGTWVLTHLGVRAPPSPIKRGSMGRSHMLMMVAVSSVLSQYTSIVCFLILFVSSGRKSGGVITFFWMGRMGMDHWDSLRAVAQRAPSAASNCIVPSCSACSRRGLAWTFPSDLVPPPVVLARELSFMTRF